MPYRMSKSVILLSFRMPLRKCNYSCYLFELQHINVNAGIVQYRGFEVDIFCSRQGETRADGDYERTAMASISTRPPRGSLATA